MIPNHSSEGTGTQVYTKEITFEVSDLTTCMTKKIEKS